MQTPNDHDEAEDDAMDGAAEQETILDDGEDTSFVDDDGEYVDRSANRALKALEEELGTTTGLLRRNAKILYCDALFEETTQPRTVKTLARIDSPAGTNKYIEVHFSYHSCCRMSSIEWFYTLGYNIFPNNAHTPATDPEVFRGRAFASMYSRVGWRPISYACYDDENNHGPTWKRIEVFGVGLIHTGLAAAHEALWGAPPPGASAERQRALVRTLRVLLASVGIEYTIACTDDEVDLEPGGYGIARRKQVAWVLEAAGDRWLARGVRKACGFELERDPEEEMRGRRNREEEARGYDDNDDDDSE